MGHSFSITTNVDSLAKLVNELPPLSFGVTVHVYCPEPLKVILRDVEVTLLLLVVE